ncbi:hypothetical protein FE257_001923 [Aspergillus nanangensis]|uniref:Major facilitator superfamily (MFS) profile domain-containing protein n=1 Tax=Aspergillus nanangensis TaxID=2582783 RepID=A0AAD4GQD8_ASPNN|nr:hypothetical protein FE257_001923 [Aspergillus nanangensis]
MKSRSVLEAEHTLVEHGFELVNDSSHVRWKASNNEHPRNWSIKRKSYDMVVILLLEFFTTAVSTAGATTAKHARRELDVGYTVSILIYMSTYQIGQGIGNIVFPPYSEAFGRKKLYIISATFYAAFCAVIAACPSPAAASVSRLITGFLSAIPSVVVCGSIEDMFNSKSRAWMIYLYIAATNCGISFGPIMSAYITSTLGWKWIFYVAAIVTGTLAILLLAIKESRPSLLLGRHVERLRKITGNPDLRPLDPDQIPDLKAFARIALFRPLHLLVLEPIVLATALMSGVANGLLYLFTETIPPIYQSFGFSENEASLPFLAFAVALIANGAMRVVDRTHTSKISGDNQPVPPEGRLLGLSLGVPILAVGLWLFAWTVPPLTHVHWLVSAFALLLVGFSLNEFCTVVIVYLADIYLNHATSATAALSIVRASLGAVFPLFAPQMFETLGPNIAASVLAAIATVFCIVPPLFKRYGELLRRKSKFSHYSKQVYGETAVDGE